MWRSLYPALVARLGGDGLQTRDWPAFLRLSAEMERIAFGPPPLNAAKLLALVDAGRIDLSFLRAATLASEHGHTALRSERGTRTVDVVIDAVLPAPGASNDGGLVGRLVTDGHARVPEGRRGLEVTPAGSCRGRDGSITPGLSAVGRPTEDSVIGNDTLSRTLHPQADRWARRIVARSRELSLEAATTRADGGARVSTRMESTTRLPRRARAAREWCLCPPASSPGRSPCATRPLCSPAGSMPTDPR